MVFERVHNCVLWMRIMWWCTTTYNDPKHEKSHLENRILKGKQWYSHLCSGTLSSSTSQMGVWGFPPHLIAQWNGRAPVLLQFQQIMSCPSPSKQTECGSCLDSLEWRSQRNRNCQQTVVGDYALIRMMMANEEHIQCRREAFEWNQHNIVFQLNSIPNWEC